MAVAGTAEGSSRAARAESSRLAWAFVISLCLHLLVGGTYYEGKKLGWWQSMHWPAWLQKARMLTELLKKKEESKPPEPRDIPLMFIDVSPAQVAVEPPKDAKYYSDKNSRAANVEATKQAEIPNLTGKQTEVPATVDVPKEKFLPLQPSHPAPPAPQRQEEVKAKTVEPIKETPKEVVKPKEPVADLAMAKPEAAPKKDEGKAVRPRPRTVEEYAALHPEWRPPSERMKQNGGVPQLHLDSVDAKATPFGAYDAALIEAIKLRWYTLLEERHYSTGGKVVLQFHLHSDGRITDMTVTENTAGEVLGYVCQKAVLDPAPFQAWPGDMRRLLGDTRGIQFTFFYN